MGADIRLLGSLIKWCLSDHFSARGCLRLTCPHVFGRVSLKHRPRTGWRAFVSSVPRDCGPEFARQSRTKDPLG